MDKAGFNRSSGLEKGKKSCIAQFKTIDKDNISTASRVDDSRAQTVGKQKRCTLSIVVENFSVGENRRGTAYVLVVNHTFNEIEASNENIIIFSSRKATNREKQEYMEVKR